MKFDATTGLLIPEKVNKIKSNLWRKNHNEKWYVSFLFFPFRILFAIIRIIYNSILFLFKNFSVFLVKFIIYIIFVIVIVPLRIIVWILTFGKKKAFKDWLEKSLMKVDFWKHRGYIS